MEQHLIDLHCDTLSALYKNGEKASLTENDLCVNIKGLRQGNSLAQFFACYVNAKESEGEEMWEKSYQQVLGMIDRMEEECGKCPDIRIAKNASQIRENQREGRISAVLTVEEGGVLNGKPERIRTLYEKGIRLITLTWNYENCLGAPNSRDASVMEKGMTEFGIRTVGEMNRLGMLIDVSHLSDGGFWDCIRCSDKPVIASHSNARALCPHPRNLSDAMLRALVEKGGVAGLNFYPVFLKEQADQVSLQDLARHAKYMIETAGEDFPALGSDFDGFTGPELTDYLTDISQMEQLWNAMKKAGITERQLDKIWQGNAMRIIEEVL